MNQFRVLTVMVVAFAFFFSASAIPAYAADDASQKTKTEAQSKNDKAAGDTQARSGQASRDDRAQMKVAPNAPMRVSNITGSKVKNMKGEDLGNVEDLVLAPDGRVQYLIIAHGGWLNIGDRLFAIPWEAAKPTNEPNTFAVNIDRERLANAPNFDRNTWPNFADPNVYNLNYGYYMSKPQKEDQQRK